MAVHTRTAVLDRLLEPLGQCLTLGSARKIVSLRADPDVQARIDELAEKCNEGQFTAEERAEYELYISTGTFIAILQAKARTFLSQHGRH